VLRACGERSLPKLVQKHQGTSSGVTQSKRDLIEIDHERGLELKGLSPDKKWSSAFTFETDSRVDMRVKTGLGSQLKIEAKGKEVHSCRLFQVWRTRPGQSYEGHKAMT